MVNLERSHAGVSGMKYTKTTGTRGRIAPGRVARRQGRIAPRINITRKPLLQKAGNNTPRVPLSSVVDISLKNVYGWIMKHYMCYYHCTSFLSSPGVHRYNRHVCPHAHPSNNLGNIKMLQTLCLPGHQPTKNKRETMKQNSCTPSKPRCKNKNCAKRHIQPLYVN